MGLSYAKWGAFMNKIQKNFRYGTNAFHEPKPRRTLRPWVISVGGIILIGLALWVLLRDRMPYAGYLTL